MATLTIPVDVTYENIVQEVSLEGTTYRMAFRWNDREEYWYLDLADVEDNLILGAIKLVAGADLLRYVIDPEIRPPGTLLVLETPGRNTLGASVPLVYVESE